MAAQTNGISKPLFDAQRSDASEVVRQVLLRRIRTEPSFNELKLNFFGGGFSNHVEFATSRDKDAFPRFVLDTFWSLVVEGMVAPGNENGDPGLPFFHVTEHGRRVFADPDYQPHDPAEYLRQLGQNIVNPDSTVLAYLKESLDCFAHGMIVASTTMLGVAAERVFLLVCESLLANLKNPVEQTAFQKILDRNPMKPKLDLVTDKFRQIQTPKRPPDLPEDVDIKIAGIYNLIRVQRNDLGHPREAPPTVTRDDAYGYLRLFPSYYATAEKVREFLAKNKV
jgi:hypothetical protein